MAIKHRRKVTEAQIDVEHEGVVYRALIRSGSNGGVVINPEEKEHCIVLMNATPDEVIRYLKDSHVPTSEVECAVASLHDEDCEDVFAPVLGGEG